MVATKNMCMLLTWFLLGGRITHALGQHDSLQPNSWIRHTIDSSSSGADGVKLADVNGDGCLDITTGWEEGGITKLYLQPDTQRVNEPWAAVTVGATPHVEDAVFVDINSDGHPDILSCMEGIARKIIIHLSPKTDWLNPTRWQPVVLPASDGRMMWMYAEPLQVDRQHGVDIVAAGKGEGAALGWFEAPEMVDDWGAWKWHRISPVGWVMSIILRDMDQDGDTDVVITDRRGEQQGCRWLENPGTITAQKKVWKNHLIGAEGMEVMFLDIADVNGDGIEEVIVTERTDQTIRMYYREDKTGADWKEHVIVLPDSAGNAKSVAVGDINGDGVADLVHSTNTDGKSKVGLTWVDGRYLQKPSDLQFQNISGVHPAKYDRVELIDLDSDGDLDVLTCEENYGSDSRGLGVIWYENRLN